MTTRNETLRQWMTKRKRLMQVLSAIAVSAGVIAVDEILTSCAPKPRETLPISEILKYPEDNQVAVGPTLISIVGATPVRPEEPVTAAFQIFYPFLEEKFVTVSPEFETGEAIPRVITQEWEIYKFIVTGEQRQEFGDIKLVDMAGFAVVDYISTHPVCSGKPCEKLKQPWTLVKPKGTPTGPQGDLGIKFVV